MTQSAATRPSNAHSLLPADGQDNGSAHPGFLARLEAEGTSPAVTQPPRRRLWPGFAVGVLVLLLIVGGIVLWLQPDEQQTPHITRQTVSTTTPTQRRAIHELIAAESPLSANAIAFQFLIMTRPSPLATFTPLAELNADIDALAAAEASNVLPDAMAADWQATGFADVNAVDARALDDIDTPSLSRGHRRPSHQDSDAELLEMLMRRLDQGGGK